jgi:hypothetical protein
VNEPPLFVSGECVDADGPRHTLEHSHQLDGALGKCNPRAMYHERQRGCAENWKGLRYVVMPRARAVKERDRRKVGPEKVERCECRFSEVERVNRKYDEACRDSG